MKDYALALTCIIPQPWLKLHGKNCMLNYANKSWLCWNHLPHRIWAMLRRRTTEFTKVRHVFVVGIFFFRILWSLYGIRIFIHIVGHQQRWSIRHCLPNYLAHSYKRRQIYAIMHTQWEYSIPPRFKVDQTPTFRGNVTRWTIFTLRSNGQKIDK